jgi:hypothetical protein
MKLIYKFIACLSIVSGISMQAAGQDGMSLGKRGQAPNPYARLDIEATDKGVLVPRLNSAQRNSMQPDASAKGLLVYDTDISVFMYFDGESWQRVTPPETERELQLDGSRLRLMPENSSVQLPKQSLAYLEDENALLFDGTKIPLAGVSADNDPYNEIQKIYLSGNTIHITKAQDSSSLVLPAAATGHQKLSFDPLTNWLSLENGGSVDLSKLDQSDNMDTDPANELQQLRLSQDTLYITQGNYIVLPEAADYQNLSLDDQNILTIENGNSIDLSRFLQEIITPEQLAAQTLSLNGKVLEISRGNSVDFSELLQQNLPPAEPQVLSFSGDSLRLSGGGGAVKALQEETDPVWMAEKSNYATKADLQAAGALTVNWENITNLPPLLDLDYTDDFSGIYGDLTGKPTDGLADNSVPRWDAAAGAFAQGSIWDSGTSVGIGGPQSASYKLFVHGKFGSAGINELSDARLKAKVSQININMDSLSMLRGVRYIWDTIAAGRKMPEGTEIGFIAQEVEAIFPELVHTDEYGYKTVQYSRLAAILLEAVKELNATLAQQQKTIDTMAAAAEAQAGLSARLDTLQAQVSLLEVLIQANAGAGK